MILKQGLTKPNEIYTREKFLAYSPAMRFKYIQKLIKEFVKVNDGITIAEIEQELRLNYETIVRHLDRLEATGDFYKATYGKTKVYFSNHKNMHPIGTVEINLGTKKFYLSILNQRSEDILFIQEKVVEPKGGYVIRGGILVPLKDTNDLFSGIRIFLQSYKNYDKGGSKDEVKIRK
jgi:hypothetical protein|tara:strand:+ start:5014 stop:5544 length:531 start_codon:yes stop_codon:yes gene_type:complete